MVVKDRRRSALTVKRRWYWITDAKKVRAEKSQKATQRNVRKEVKEAPCAASSSGSEGWPQGMVELPPVPLPVRVVELVSPRRAK